MKSVSILGVIVGGVTDIVATNILTLPLGVAAVLAGNVLQLPKAQQSAAVLAWMHAHPALYVTAIVLGSAASVLGGFVAALIAKRSEVLNGALSSFLCIGSGIYAIAHGTTGEPIWVTIAMMPLSPALGALGGHFRRITHSHRMKSAASS